MRIEQQNIGGVGGAGSYGSVGSTGGTSSHGVEAHPDKTSDTVKLSSASSLIALAKNVNSADKQSRIASLTTQVRSGAYRPDLSATSQAIVNGLKA